MAINGILLGQNNNSNIEISEQNFQSFTTAGSYSYTISKTGWYYILMSGGGWRWIWRLALYQYPLWQG